jgi:hypothetical protein
MHALHRRAARLEVPRLPGPGLAFTPGWVLRVRGRSRLPGHAPNHLRAAEQHQALLCPHERRLHERELLLQRRLRPQHLRLTAAMSNRFIALVVTCAERRAVCEGTLWRFRQTDWGVDPELQFDDGAAPSKLARIHATWIKALERVATGPADFALILEDDLDFNRHLRHNLDVWGPLLGRDGNVPFFGSVYNPERPGLWRPAKQSYFIVYPRQMWGAQAVLVSRLMAGFFLRHWSEEEGAADLRMPRLGARLAPVYLHTPSLVQHVGDASTWGGPFHQASDFDRNWRASSLVVPRSA